MKYDCTTTTRIALEQNNPLHFAVAAAARNLREVNKTNLNKAITKIVAPIYECVCVYICWFVSCYMDML